MSDFWSGLGFLVSISVFCAVVLMGGWWNLVDSIGYALRRIALRGRARSRRIEMEISDRWARLYEPAE